MTYTQYVADCPGTHATGTPCSDYPDCEVIVCRDDTGRQVWESHAHKRTHVGCRIGDVLPACEDKRTGETHEWVEQCADCATHFSSSTRP